MSDKWRKENPERTLELGRKHDAIRRKKTDRREYTRNYLRAWWAKKDFPIVYAWMAPDGIADWVGRGNLRRALSHKSNAKSKRWYTPKHILITMSCDTEWQAMEYEGKWGAKYQPRFNKEGYRHG